MTLKILSGHFFLSARTNRRAGDPGGREVEARNPSRLGSFKTLLRLWNPHPAPPGIGSGYVAQADARNATVKARQIRQYLVRLISPGRDTGSNGRRRGRRPLPGKDPS